ncbi:hypothetical protein [Novosphingobium sp.]|uniref:hypothetical protein n=1 Tax=Novosphingobium sp. TaxID=1874826 RepID=UPI003B51A817
MPKATKALYDHDRLVNASQRTVSEGCVRIFDRIQGWPKENQILSLAAAFLLACMSARIPAQDAFTATKNLMADPLTSSGMGAQFQAMKFHLDTEVNA